jgi:plasmid replication initiation protein
MTDLVELKDSNLVIKANLLVEASYRLTTMEQKIILALASKIQVSDSELKTYSLSIREFCDLLGIQGNNQYTRLRKTTLGLMKKAFEIRINEKDVVQVSWLSFAKYRDQQGIVDLQFAPFLKEYLIELRKNFTSYTLSNVVRLKHSYSIRLYELLKQYEKIGERTFDFEDLLSKLGLAGTSYKTFGNLKSRVLVPATTELNEMTDLKIDFTEIKSGRKVVGIRFSIGKNTKNIPEQPTPEVLKSEKTKPEENKPKPQPKTNPDVDMVKNLIAANNLIVNDKDVDKLIGGWLERGLNTVLEYLLYAIKEESIFNPIGFVRHAFANGLALEPLKSKVKRKEMLPEWLHEEKAQGVEKEQADEMSEEESKQKLEEERKRLEEVMKKNTKEQADLQLVLFFSSFLVYTGHLHQIGCG